MGEFGEGVGAGCFDLEPTGASRLHGARSCAAAGAVVLYELIYYLQKQGSVDSMNLESQSSAVEVMHLFYCDLGISRSDIRLPRYAFPRSPIFSAN